MRIYDVFTYAGEADILECRLVEFGCEADVIVIVEGTRTHQGHPRQVSYPAQASRFTRWSSQIRHRVIELPLEPGLPPATSAFDLGDRWERFRLQQEGGWQGMADAQADDIVFFGDVDEIPHRGLSSLHPEPDEVLALEQRHHMMAFDWLAPENPWCGTGVATVATARKWTLHRLRVARPKSRRVPNGGWHLSWFGDQAAARQKVSSYTHPEVAQGRGAAWFWHWDDNRKSGIGYDGDNMAYAKFDSNHPEDWPRLVLMGGMESHWVAQPAIPKGPA